MWGLPPPQSTVPSLSIPSLQFPDRNPVSVLFWGFFHSSAFTPVYSELLIAGNILSLPPFKQVRVSGTKSISGSLFPAVTEWSFFDVSLLCWVLLLSGVIPLDWSVWAISNRFIFHVVEEITTKQRTPMFDSHHGEVKSCEMSPSISQALYATLFVRCH